MAFIILVTGGSRSGKSLYAECLALRHDGPRIYLATAPRCDIEMIERIEKHQKRRNPNLWETIEEKENLSQVFINGSGKVILVDCLTLWIHNLLERNKDIQEEDLVNIWENSFKILDRYSKTVIFVTNEVGMGLVPPNYSSRNYRDLLGRTNQLVAQKAQKVVFLISGIPIIIKGSNNAKSTPNFP